jgi:hypothetical protein
LKRFKYSGKKEADNGQRPSGVEENCVGSHDPKRTAVLEKKKKKKKNYN